MNSEDMMPNLDVNTYTPPGNSGPQTTQQSFQVQEQGMQQMMSALAQQGQATAAQNAQNTGMFMSALNGMMKNGDD